ncbi:S41 family peptidase [Candidatus Berkelbacteria bacterium]|nr:S41 family peptidase [Candidatus Berkelbacteria bacterium]
MRQSGKIGFFVTILAAFSLGALVGGKVVLDDPSQGLGKVVNDTLGQPADVDYGLYWDVYQRIVDRYPGDVDKQQLLYGAIRGTVDGLGDRYSLFMDPEETRRFFEDIKGEFSGIGAEIEVIDQLYTIVAPLPGSPAETAGLKPGDVIVAVDGKSYEEFDFASLIAAIRGPEGTTVELEVLSEKGNQRKVTVKRETITVASVTAETRDDGITVINLNQFSDDTASEFADAVKAIQKDSTRGVVLDLRNNPGGYLDASIDVASVFVDLGPIVIEENKAGERQEFSPTLEASLKGVPTVVLVNKGSASASEIVAGAIQDRDAGTIVGTKTFGKGSVQEVESLEDGSSLRLTVAKWLTPSGRAINGEGITPDVEVEDNEETEADEQLDKALELLKQ